MSTILQIHQVSKRYMLSHLPLGHTTLVETLSHKAKTWFHACNPFSARSLRSNAKTQTEEFWALQNINLEIKEGDRIALIGRNGAGKSTLLKILARITEPTTGYIKIHGRVASLLEVGTGFHPELTGKENIFLNGAILGMTQREIKHKFDEIVAFAEVEAFLDTPVKRFSSGMYTRLGFAIAAHLDPDVLIIDEVLAVGDGPFQEKCLKKLNTLSQEKGRTVLFVSHDMGSVLTLCNKGVLLDKGEIKEMGPVDSVVNSYMKDCRTHGLEWSGEVGDEHIRFYKMTLSASEKQREFFYQDEQTTLEVEYEVLQSDDNLCFGIGIWNYRNQLLARAHTLDEAEQMASFSRSGRHRASLRIDAGLFHEGEYLLKLDSFVHNKKHIIRDEVILKFIVYPRRKNTRFLNAPGIQGVVLGKPWKLNK